MSPVFRWNCYTTLIFEMKNLILKVPQTQSYQALSVLTVSDHLLTGEATSSEERQTTFKDMIVVALEAAIQE